jgi:hypothetical protein
VIVGRNQLQAMQQETVEDNPAGEADGGDVEVVYYVVVGDSNYVETVFAAKTVAQNRNAAVVLEERNGRV